MCIKNLSTKTCNNDALIRAYSNCLHRRTQGMALNPN